MYLTPLLIGLIIGLTSASCCAAELISIDFSNYQEACPVKITHDDGLLTVSWPVDKSQTCSAELSLQGSHPLLGTLAESSATGERVILKHASPEFELFVGERRKNSKGPHTFFDRVDERQYSNVPLQLDIEAAQIMAHENRASVRLNTLQGDGFSGSLQFTFFAGTRLIHVEAIISTDQTNRAILFRGGLSAPNEQVKSVVYHRAGDSLQTIRSSLLVPYRPWKLQTIGRRQGFGERDFDQNTTPLIGRETDGILRARHRAVAMETGGGAIAVFPAPHKFLYPLDFADNVGFNFAWNRSDQVEVGVRQPPLGDGRFRPWVDCPPGSRQHLDLFLFASANTGNQVLSEVAKLTNDERYPQLDGFKTFTSHYHMWHTRELIQAQQKLGTQEIPPSFRRPLFIDKMKDTGIDIAHLAEFHGGPRTGQSRLKELQVLHRECARLSDGEILVLPGEEPNVHLGGHWVSFFPNPVYWDFADGNPAAVRERIKTGSPPPFQRDDPELGTVYYVDSASDVQKLFETEGGLYWTAHPRIKGSTGFPDRYRAEPYFKSPSFFGAAWKAMPANYSHDRLGKRVLDLLDDMNTWGEPKQILGEADLFKLNPASELYGHANINYLKLDRVPRFEDGWSEVLNALRERKYFTSTGEVLISSFRVDGEEFPGQIPFSDADPIRVTAEVQGTFPLAYAEVVYSDGTSVFRERIDLKNFGTFSTTSMTKELPRESCKWLRLEVWDIAENGAFTQPVLFPASE